MHGGKRDGAGRKAGSPNKITTELKQTILDALEQSHPEGAIGYLKEQAVNNPNAFMTLIGKVLPLSVSGEGKDGSIIIEVVKHAHSDTE